MTTTDNGYFLDPFDPELYRERVDGLWTVMTRTGPDAEPAARAATHVGKAMPIPGQAAGRVAVPATQSRTAADTTTSNAPVVIAIVWAIAAAIIGGIFIFGTQDVAYGGDAYTGIQNTGAQTVRAIGWLIVATGPLSLVIALSRR